MFTCIVSDMATHYLHNEIISLAGCFDELCYYLEGEDNYWNDDAVSRNLTLNENACFQFGKKCGAIEYLLSSILDNGGSRSVKLNERCLRRLAVAYDALETTRTKVTVERKLDLSAFTLVRDTMDHARACLGYLANRARQHDSDEAAAAEEGGSGEDPSAPNKRTRSDTSVHDSDPDATEVDTDVE